MTATLLDLASDVASNAALLADEESPFKCFVHDGDTRVLLVVGPNASGKSLLVQIMAQWGRKAPYDWSPVTVSIRERTGAGSSDMSGMRRTMMFGDESKQSTGATSVRVTETAFNNIWMEGSNQPRLLFLDEPDLGLSEDYAQAMGLLIARRTEEAFKERERQSGVIVVTHSRSLVRGILEGGIRPALVTMEQDQSLDEWLAKPAHRSLDELLSLEEVARNRRLAVMAMIKSSEK